VAYTPPSGNPNEGVEATAEAIQKDLDVLRQAKFAGLVTYGSGGIMGKELPEFAKKAGFKGLIMGIWDPGNQQEIAAAVAAGANPIVLGYCVGNEGLPEKGQTNGRYTLEQLTAVIQSLRTLTSKPVTTAEQYDDYTDERLLTLGDWVFPTAHPYFHHKQEPREAVTWTKDAYNDLKKRSGRFVLLKEAGLPTAGDEEGKMSEVAQEAYYVQLAKTDIKFVYFEGFDQPWKKHLGIEPHWGIFTADRTPKLLGARLQKGTTTVGTGDSYFYVYEDADSRRNHFTPGGFMGDFNDIRMDDQFKQNPRSGSSCIRVKYSARGTGPGKRPVRWAGVYWLQPGKNWGQEAKWQGRGYDLSAYSRLTFCARADRECFVEFKVGGNDHRYGDSLKEAREIRAKLTPSWQHYEIGLRGADLRHIIGGFCWATDWETNSDGIVFYLDDIRFERN
jgi:exo-beta-1,3-glucanase (GH17 family)